MESDPREVIRGTAAWALGKIGGEEAAEALHKAAEQEQSEEVMAEIRKGISMLQQPPALRKGTVSREKTEEIS